MLFAKSERTGREIMECENCKFQQRIELLEKDSERNQATHKEFFDRLERLNVNDATSDVKYGNILVTLGRLEAQLAEILAKPSKRWDGMVMAAITAIVGLAVGYIIK